MGKQSALPAIPLLLQHPCLMALQHPPPRKGMIPCGAAEQGQLCRPQESCQPRWRRQRFPPPAGARAEPGPSRLLAPAQGRYRILQQTQWV